MDAAQAQIFEKAVNFMAAAAATNRTPVLYGADNRPLAPSSGYNYSRTAAKRAGSLKNWVPQRLVGRQAEAMERERIAARSIDLVNNDPHASGIVESYAVTVIGPGLTPHPIIDPDAVQMNKEEIRAIMAQQRAAYLSWAPFADAGGRMDFGAIQFLLERNMIQYGEYLVALHMIDDPVRPYSLACQVLNPLRMKTPVDKVNDPNIRDGVEMGEYGEPIAYWIKKSDPRGMDVTPDVSANFLRMPARKGHRWNVLHNFIPREAEAVRGGSSFAPAMKFFRDLNDYLDAELVSNIVTAAFALFIETGTGNDPYQMAQDIASFSEQNGATGRTDRYQEWVPGQVLYGAKGEKPNPIEASRPGATFQPFVKTIMKAIAVSMNMPYPVLFKDAEATNFAGFRSAMLDAWRVYMHHRIWMGNGFCQPVYTMLQEEAYLRGNLRMKNFYSKMWIVTRAEWRGQPKGDIEPIKAVQADVLAIQNNLKTRAASIAERGSDIVTTFDQLQEEQRMMEERGLTEKPIEAKDIKDEHSGALDDEEGAGRGMDQS